MPTILVVDDNELLCRLMCEILRTEGYRAIAATSARQALEAFKREECDLVVTDFLMPGMNGLELARAVRDKNPQLPVIIMSVYEPVTSEHVTLWLPKGYLFPAILDTIRGCLPRAETENVASSCP